MRRYLLFLLFSSIFHFVSQGQTHRVYGKVVDRQLQPLILASVEIKDSKLGKVTKEDGTYEFNLDPGNYDIIVSMIGYKPKILSIFVDKDIEQNFILLEDEGPELGEVIIKAKARDRAEEIIRSVIKHKDELLAAAGNYSCNIYIKAVQEDSIYRKGKIEADTSRSQYTSTDFANMAMAEVLIHLDKGSNQLYKEERLGLTKRNETDRLYYLSTSEGDFNLYNNLIKVPTVSQIPFISPVSYSGLVAYRFKTLRIDNVGNHKVYTISIKPRQLSNATVEGEITIDDSSKAILRSTFELPVFHLPEYDYFLVSQEYSFVNNTAWMLTRQQFNYYSKTGRARKTGETVAVYNNFELNKSFRKGHFGNEVIVTSQQAYEKDSAFWSQIRTQPLTQKEIRFIEYKDSIATLMRSERYLDSMDAVTNRITWKNALVFGQVFNNHRKQTRWILPPVTSVFQPFQFGGARIGLSFVYSKTFPNRKNINLITNASYGFRNHDINGSISLRRMYNPFSRGTYTVNLERDFQFIFDGDSWINMVQRSNIYLNNAIGVGHSLEIFNGLVMQNDFEIALRRSVSNYKTNSKIDSLFRDILTNNQAVPFQSYNAVYNKIRLSYTPRQRYIREPKEKIILPSKWPTVYVEWRKGLNGVLASKIDFDYLEFGLDHKPKFGTLGNGAYRVRTGSFINKRDLRLVDYQFQRRGDPLFFLDPHKAFQSLDSTFPLFERFYEGHYVHEFNGYFLNKIPLLKKLELREVAGAGFLVAPERDLRYVEFFGGIERVIKLPFNQLSKIKLGIYVVSSFANQFNNPIQFKIGIKKWDWRRNKWL